MPTNKLEVIVRNPTTGEVKDSFMITHEDYKEVCWAFKYLEQMGALNKGSAWRYMAAEVKSGVAISYYQQEEDHKIHDF